MKSSAVRKDENDRRAKEFLNNQKNRQTWTGRMMLTKSKNWGQKSPFAIAIEATSFKVVSHEATWMKISEIWRYGNWNEVCFTCKLI